VHREIEKIVKEVNINIIYFNYVKIFDIDDFYLNINKNNQQI
jgi:hypothetical protein